MTAYRLGIFLGDLANAVSPRRASLDDVVCRLDDIRNLLLHLSARPAMARDASADTPPADTASPVDGGGHPASPGTHLPGWPGGGPGEANSTGNASPGQPVRVKCAYCSWTSEDAAKACMHVAAIHPEVTPPTDRPLSELLTAAAWWLRWNTNGYEHSADLQALHAELLDASAQMRAVESEPF